MNECVFIYRTYHIVSQGGLQFYLSEIGRQLVEAPLAAAISPFSDLTHPPNPCMTTGKSKYRCYCIQGGRFRDVRKRETWSVFVAFILINRIIVRHVTLWLASISR